MRLQFWFEAMLLTAGLMVSTPQLVNSCSVTHQSPEQSQDLLLTPRPNLSKRLLKPLRQLQGYTQCQR